MEALAANPLATAAGIVFVGGAPLAALWAILGWSIPEFSSAASRWLRPGIVILIVANWLFVIVRG